ncbi:MAG: aldehyde dehydrogenase family protein [Bacillota bacterium]|jgi:acyl-CoA reductase-like NAD-dependent aldehyde dehydrogenase|nr:aldehyde dehydrogenase family protein [Bacillota bacterium]
MNYKMWIDGLDAEASDGMVQENRNPATGELIGTVPAATKQDVDRAIASAKEGQKEWAKLPLYKRIEVFSRYELLLQDHRSELAELMAKEGGKLIGDAEGEIDIQGYIFRTYGEGARNLYGLTVPTGIEPRVERDVIFTRHEPLGVVACIVPFNYPSELFAHKVAPALIMGNSVVVKPASDTPMSAIAFAKLLVEAGVTPNAIQVVTGSGSKIGDWITQNPDIAAISLTGSTKVGRHVMEQASSHVAHVFLELGGNDPLIIMGDADLDQAVGEAIGGRISNAGQTCCASKRILVQNSVKDVFTEKLIAAVKKLKMGDPMDRTTNMGPVINEKAAQKVIEDIEFTLNEGAICVLGGKAKGAFVEPTILAGVTRDMEIAKSREVFGPVLPIIGFDTLEEAVDISNQSEYGLHAGILTGDMKKALNAAVELECGCVVIGGCGNYRCAHQAFGGCKQTGTGREGISYTLLELSRTKTIAYRNILDT